MVINQTSAKPIRDFGFFVTISVKIVISARDLSFRIESFYIELRRATELAVLIWSHTGEFLEGRAKMGLAGETGRERDLCERTLARGNFTAGKLNSELANVFANCRVIVMAKCRSEIHRV